MNKRDEFLKSQKILRLATAGNHNTPHIVPVWYLYGSKRIFIGTNQHTQKAKNIQKNRRVSFCVDVGVHSPDIYGVSGEGDAKIILEKSRVKRIATKILLRYFKNMENKSAKQLLDETDCIIEISPEKFSTWSY